MNITDSQSDYVNELTQKLSNAGIRVKADLRNEKIGFKIREHTLRRSHICWSVVIKRWNLAKLPFAPAVVKTWEAWT